MIGADSGQSADFADEEVLAVEEMIEWPAEKKVICVEAVVHTAATTWIEQSADAPEALRRSRPAHIVEISTDHNRIGVLCHFQSDSHEFAVPLNGLGILRRAGWCGVEKMKPDPAPGPKDQVSMHGRHIVFDDEAYFGILQG